MGRLRGPTTHASNTFAVWESVFAPAELDAIERLGDRLVQRRAEITSQFPSFFLHCVTPIVSGTRKSLVIWASGPEFR